MNENTFSSVVRAFETATDKEGHRLTMDSLIVSQGDKRFEHFFNSENEPNDLRSLSKPILCMALGIAIKDGLHLRNQKLGLDTPIWQFFADKIKLTNEANKSLWQRVKLKHLLTHTIGYEVGLLFSKDIKDRSPDTLLEYVFNYPIAHEPGDFFVYSNVGPYILSALIQEELGIGLAEWVNRLLFEPLGISEFSWKNYGKYCAASSGLKLSHADLHKVSRLFIDGGRYQGRQLVPLQWLELMRTAHVQTPSMYDEARVFPKFAYGFYLWICKNGSYYCDGTDGQYLIVLPKTGTLITTFGHQSDMKPITECLRPLL